MNVVERGPGGWFNYQHYMKVIYRSYLMKQSVFYMFVKLRDLRDASYCADCPAYRGTGQTGMAHPCDPPLEGNIWGEEAPLSSSVQDKHRFLRERKPIPDRERF